MAAADPPGDWYNYCPGTRSSAERIKASPPEREPYTADEQAVFSNAERIHAQAELSPPPAGVARQL